MSTTIFAIGLSHPSPLYNHIYSLCFGPKMGPSSGTQSMILTGHYNNHARDTNALAMEC